MSPNHASSDGASDSARLGEIVGLTVVTTLGSAVDAILLGVKVNTVVGLLVGTMDEAFEGAIIRLKIWLVMH